MTASDLGELDDLLAGLAQALRPPGAWICEEPGDMWQTLDRLKQTMGGEALWREMV